MLSHERLFPRAPWKALPVNLDCVSSVPSHEAPSKAISSPPSIQMIINHVIITLTGVHLRIGGGERNVFVRWKNNLWSFYVPLRTLENNNTPQQRQQKQLKGTECYKSDGICIFFSSSRGSGRRNHTRGEEMVFKKPSEAPEFTLGRACFSTTHFLIENIRISRENLDFFKLLYLKDY